jgi:hypothetical protein
LPSLTYSFILFDYAKIWDRFKNGVAWQQAKQGGFERLQLIPSGDLSGNWLLFSGVLGILRI